MFSSILIANRGEIACRIARTAKRLSLRTIAVYSDADINALHVRMCDDAYAIGPAPALESYLNIESLVAAIKRSGAACVHPGYGFLSENPAFAEACAQAGAIFVGPPADAIRLMGLKDRAKSLMEKAGVPVLPGYHGELQDPQLLKRKAYEIGYPVMIKAAAGGGGKGMRRVEKHADFDQALQSVMRETAAAFGDTRVLIEKYVTAPRHVEMQVFADTCGNVIHLGERDCSLQRRHQKVIEEAPGPSVTPEMRACMGEAAIAAAKAVNYVGAGTVEFIVDAHGGPSPSRFWFMEMNTRLQVEHPVTEAVTGIDLVEWQLRVAAGEELPLMQNQISLNGHAIEARLYAEDPEHGFLPSSGKLLALSFPSDEDLRVDAGVEEGDAVTPHYDPLIAKLIAYAPTREGALEKLEGALACTRIAGPHSNVAFLTALCRAREVRKGTFDTTFIDGNREALGCMPQEIDYAAAARGVECLVAREKARISVRREPNEIASPWDLTDDFQLTGRRMTEIPVIVNGQATRAFMTSGEEGAVITVAGIRADAQAMAVETDDAVYILRCGRQTIVRPRDFETSDTQSSESDGVIKAPMHGKILALLVKTGEKVVKGHPLAVIEAMKMEHALIAPLAGIVTTIATEVGRQVAEGATIVVIKPPVEDS